MPFLNRIGSGSTNKFGFRMGFVPGAPTSVTASLPSTYGNTTASVSWTAPVTVGSPALNDYKIQFSSDSGSTFTTFSDGVSTSTSVTVTGLTNGTAYVFRVAAVNTIGTGAFSGNSNSVTPLFGKIATPVVSDIEETTSQIKWCYDNYASQSQADGYVYNYYDYNFVPNDQSGSCQGWGFLAEDVTRFTYVYLSKTGWANSDSIYLSETTHVTPPDPCDGSPAAGTVTSGNYCSGYTLVRNVSDGCNGSTVQTVESNSATCGYPAPGPCDGSPAAGTVTSGNYCSGYTLVRNVSDGCNGSTVQTVEVNSETCGWVDIPVACNPFTGYEWNGAYYIGAISEGGASCAAWCNCNAIVNGYTNTVWKVYTKAGCPNANLFIGC